MDYAKRKADRLRLMRLIFEESEGSELNFVQIQPLMQNLGLTDQEAGDICRYLEGEGLIEGIHTLGTTFPLHVRITHWGIKEIEQSVESPDEATEHFPPAVSVINIHGSVIGSPIQSGSPGASQVTSIGDINLGQVREFLAAYDSRAHELGLSEEDAAEVRAEVETIRAQVESPKPKLPYLRGSLESVQRLLEGAGGSVAATYLLEMIQHIHF